LQIGTDLLLIITRPADELSECTKWMTLNDLEFQKIVFFAFSWLGHTFQEGIAPKSLEIDEGNLCVKFSALNVNFNILSCDPLGSRSHLYGGVGTPLKRVINCTLYTDSRGDSILAVADRHGLAAYRNKQC